MRTTSGKARAGDGEKDGKKAGLQALQVLSVGVMLAVVLMALFWGPGWRGALGSGGFVEGDLQVTEATSDPRSFEEVLEAVRMGHEGDYLLAKRILKPLVSVIIPFHNADQWFGETLASLRAQTFADFEVIVVDDCSTGAESLRTLGQLRDSCPLLHGQRFYLRILTHSVNRGLSARGHYVLFLDPDDRLVPTALEKLVLMAAEVVNVDTRRTGSRVGFVYPGVEHFGDKTEVVYADYSKRRLTRENYITSCALIDRATYLSGGGMCEGEIRYFEDYDFWLRLASANIAGRLLREPLFQYRRHSLGRSSVIRSQISEAEYMGELRRNNPVVFGDLPPNHELARNLPCYRPLFLTGDLNHADEVLALATRLNIMVDVATMPRSSQWFSSLLEMITTQSAYPSVVPFLQQQQQREEAGVREALNRSGMLSVLYIIPWMVMGGADLYDLHILQGLRLRLGDRVRLTLVTTVETQHTWEGDFSAVVDEIFHLPRITNDSSGVDQVLDHLLFSREAKIAVSRNNEAGYRAFERWRTIFGLTESELALADILHLENRKFEEAQPSPQSGWEEKSLRYHDLMTWRMVASDHLLTHLTTTHKISRDKFTVIYPAVNSTVCCPEQAGANKRPPLILGRTMKSAGSPVVAFVGRFEEQKDPLAWVRVAAEVAKRRREAGREAVVFLMMGDGWLRAQTEWAAREAGLASSFLFTGLLDHAEVLDYLAVSSVLLLTSVYEGVPIVILEAICLGVPTVSTDLGGIRDLLEGGKFGATVAMHGRVHEEVVSHLAAEVSGFLDRGRLGEAEKKRWHAHCSAKYDLALFQNKTTDHLCHLTSQLNDTSRREIISRKRQFK